VDGYGGDGCGLERRIEGKERTRTSLRLCSFAQASAVIRITGHRHQRWLEDHYDAPAVLMGTCTHIASYY
jgi:hypothetical protein